MAVIRDLRWVRGVEDVDDIRERAVFCGGALLTAKWVHVLLRIVVLDGAFSLGIYVGSSLRDGCQRDAGERVVGSRDVKILYLAADVVKMLVWWCLRRKKGDEPICKTS